MSEISQEQREKVDSGLREFAKRFNEYWQGGDNKLSRHVAYFEKTLVDVETTEKSDDLANCRAYLEHAKEALRRNDPYEAGSYFASAMAFFKDHGLYKRAVHGEAMTPSKPGNKGIRSPIKLAIAEKLRNDPSLSAKALWNLISNNPPDGWRLDRASDSLYPPDDSNHKPVQYDSFPVMVTRTKKEGGIN